MTDDVTTETDDTSLDFSAETPSTSQYSMELGEEYDSRPQEDTARRRIAYLLISLLWVVVLGVMALVALGSIKIVEIKEFAVILGPIVTLVSAATGFYYGTKSSQ